MKTILLAVTGLSPQVITETLFAFHQSGRTVQAIHIVTTRDGKDQLIANLLGGGHGPYFQYLEEYGISRDSIDFGPQNIHVIRDENGVEICDIVSEQDNENLLRKCLDLSFRFTADPHTAVCFSVAGGRKTMGSCLTLAAQMYARPQDRIYHVLVSSEFESNRDFFYPPKITRLIEITDHSGQPSYKETRYAKINLIHIPFVSIREHLSDEVLQRPCDPGTLMLSLVKEDKARLVVNLISGKVAYKGLELDMMPARLALYGIFVLQKKNCGKTDASCHNCVECFIDMHAVFSMQNEIARLYQRLSDGRPMQEMSDTGIIALNPENFLSYKAKIKTDLLRRFGPYALEKLEISSTGKRPDTRYGLLIDKKAIEVVI